MVLEHIVEYEVGSKDEDHSGGESRKGPEDDSSAVIPGPGAVQAVEGAGGGKQAKDYQGNPPGGGEGEYEKQDGYPKEGKPPARKPFTVQHKDVSHIHEGGSCLALAQNRKHRDAYDGGNGQKILGA